MQEEYKKLRVTPGGLDVLVNTGTGEIRYAVSFDTHTVISKKQREAFKKLWKKEEYSKRQRQRRWVACYHDPIIELSKKLTIEQLGALIKLIPYMRMNQGGKLVYKGGEGMTRAHIQKVIQKSERQTKDIIQALVKEGVIFRKRQGKTYIHYVHKRYHTMGETRPVPFTKLFKDFARRKLEKLTLQQAGLLYMVLPYFHKDTYLLCNNPYEEDPDKIDPMTHEELCETLGLDIRTVARHMQALVRNGIVMKVSAYRAVNYIVHPDFMYRSDTETDYTQEVRKRFEDLRKTAAKMRREY